MNITIVSQQLNSHELLKELERLDDWQSRTVRFAVQKPAQGFRTLDPTIVVAIVSAVSTGLGALLSGILHVAQAAKSRTVIIQDEDGRRIEIPVDYPMEKVRELVDEVGRMAGPRIEIPKPPKQVDPGGQDLSAR